MTTLKASSLLIGTGIASLLLAGSAASAQAQEKAGCCESRALSTAGVGLTGLNVRVQPGVTLQPLKLTGLPRLSLSPIVLTGGGGGGASLLQPEGRKVVARAKARADSDGESSFVIVEDDDSVAVTMKDGKITSLEHNGRKVPLDRVKRDGDKVRILDKDGDTVFEFELKTDEGGAVEVRGLGTGAGAGGLTFRGLGRASGQGGLYSLGDMGEQPEPPKVMIGVQLAEPDASLRGHFDLDEGEATLVSAVYEGLPADKAGLGPYDIIVAVEGKEPAGQETVREALREHDEGDKIRLTVIQKGKRKDVEITVAKYDQEKLNEAEVHSVESGGAAWFGAPGEALQLFGKPGSPDFRAWRIEPGEEGQWELLGPQIRRHFERDANRAEEGADRAREGAERAREGAERARELVERAMRRRADAADEDDRMKLLEERLDRLEKMLEKAIERAEERKP